MESVNAELQATEFNFEMQNCALNNEVLKTCSNNTKVKIQKELQKQFSELTNYFMNLLKDVEAQKLEELMESYGEIKDSQEKQINELSSQIVQLHKEEKYDEIVKKSKEFEEVKKILQDCRDKLVKPKEKCDLQEEFKTIKENVGKSVEESLKEVNMKGGHKFWKLDELSSKEEYCGVSGVDFRVTIGKANFPVPKGKPTACETYAKYNIKHAFRGIIETGYGDLRWFFKGYNKKGWFQYEFDQPIAVVEFALAVPGPSSQIKYAPKEFILKFSDNGKDWETVKAFSDVTGYEVGKWRVFSLD